MKEIEPPFNDIEPTQEEYESSAKERAIQLLNEALTRIKDEPKNAIGGWQCGAAYWRLAAVLRGYLEPRLIKEEGKEHAEFIINAHGKLNRKFYGENEA